MHVVHIITRLIIGGAQENTLWNVIDQQRLFGDTVQLVTGPGLGPEGTLEPRARAAGVDMRMIDASRRNLDPFADWKTYRATKQLLRELRPDLVHTHTSKAGIVGRYAAWQLGIPTVHTVHGASFHVGQSALAFRTYRQLERWAGPWTNQFITVCDAMAEQYVAAGVAPRERFTTIRSGFDVQPYLHPATDPLQTRARLGLSADDIVIGKVARLFPLKGHQFLIEAASEVAAQVPRAKFLLVGDGILREQYTAEIARRGLSDRFVFAGLVPPEEVATLIHAMDLVVHTSEWEGLARVLPQGMIAGKPVISYDIDGAGEVVLPEETGLLLPRNSVAPLAAAIIRLARDPELCRRLGARGRELWAEPFDHEFMTRQIRGVYERVLAASAR